MFTVVKGRIIIYRLYDVAAEINLLRAERIEKEGARRLQFSKQPYMKALEFTNPPISFDLSSFNIALFGKSVKAGVIAKAYDFGVLSIVFDISVPEETAMEAIEGATRDLDTDKFIDDKAREYAAQVMESLSGAIIGPEIKEDFIEDYMIVYIESVGQGASLEEFTRLYDPTRLLLRETRRVSAVTKGDALRHRFSYYPDDLVAVHVDNAFIVEPSGSSDIPDILEFANAQILELRYYDSVIDRELNWIYTELGSRKPVSIFRLREYERLAKKLTQTVADITGVTEKVHNALKVTEDVYYARIYRTAMAILRSKDWEVAIKEKLQIVTNTYKTMHDEISIKRGYILELGIFILIVVEIFMVIFIGG
jgi:hypothetical protein